MSGFLKDWTRNFVFAPHDESGDFELFEPEEPEAPAEEVKPEEPTLEERIAKVFDAKLAEFEAKSKPKEEAPRQEYLDPESAALNAFDLRQELLEDIEDDLASLPADQRKEVRNQLKAYKTVSELEAVKKQGIHKIIADAAVGRAYKTGAVGRAQETTKAPNRETVHSEAPSKIPAWYQKNISDLESVLGVKFTPEEIEEQYRSLPR